MVPAAEPRLMRVSAAIIALDEARHIVPCVRSLAWADEILVLDGGSRDGTKALAQTAGARVIDAPFVDFAHQRQRALGEARHSWVLFVDADERVSSGLAAEIRREIRTAPDRGVRGFWIPRRNYIRGQWVRGGGWWPDYQLRLMTRTDAGYLLDRPVHELVRIDGEVAHLICGLAHYNYESYRQFVRKQLRYAEIEATRTRRAGTKPPVRALVTAPAREFWRRLVVERGYVDGIAGVTLAGLMAVHSAAVVALSYAGSERTASRSERKLPTSITSPTV